MTWDCAREAGDRAAGAGREPVDVLIDDTLFRRRGNGSGQRRGFMTAQWRPVKTGYGNNWVVLAVRVRLPMISRPVAVP